MLNFELFWDFKQRKTRGDLTWVDGIGLLGGRRMEIREDFCDLAWNLKEEHYDGWGKATLSRQERVGYEWEQESEKQEAVFIGMTILGWSTPLEQCLGSLLEN